jgi:hypothetical protein
VQQSLSNAENISSQLLMPTIKSKSSQDDEQKKEIQISSPLILKRKSPSLQIDPELMRRKLIQPSLTKKSEDSNDDTEKEDET